MFDFQLGRKRRGVVGRTTGLESVSELRRVSFAKGDKRNQTFAEGTEEIRHGRENGDSH